MLRALRPRNDANASVTGGSRTPIARGVTWAPLAADLLNAQVRQLVVDPRHQWLVAFTYGRGAWAIQLPDPASVAAGR